MKAMTYTSYGTPEVLKMSEVALPAPAKDEVRIKLVATALNASDWEFLTGRPHYVRLWGLFKPKNNILGSDIAGRIESVGSHVKHFKVGDEVFGDIFNRWGGLAEQVCVPEKLLIKKPASLSFAEAASLPQSTVVALQGLRDKGKIQSGDKVLINGAGGGAGTFAIQMAKIYGTEVTGVDRFHKFDVMQSAGADFVIDFAQEDFTKNGAGYDLILDLVGHHSLCDFKRALNPGGRYVLVGGSIKLILQVAFAAPLISFLQRLTKGKKGKHLGILGHKINQADLSYVTNLMETGKIKPFIDKQYTLSQTAEAFQYLGDGKARGKVVILVNDEGKVSKMGNP